MTPRVVAVVPTYNSERWMEDCIPALLEQRDVEVTVVVVDNGSADGTLDLVRRRWPQVETVALGENRGYGASCNEGARRHPGADVLACNPDAVLDPDCVARLAAALAADPWVGVAAPRLRNPDGTLQPSAHRFPRLRDLLGEALLLDRVAASFDYHARGYAHDAPRRGGWATGAVLLVRREAWDAVGGFDPAYRLYVEEVDLQKRLAEHGWEAVLDPAAGALHHGGKQPVPVEQFLLSHDGWARYFRRTGGAPAALAARLILLLTALVRGLAWSAMGTVRPAARPWAAMFLGVFARGLSRLGR